MTEDPFAHGFQKWESRYAEGVFFINPELEVQVAARIYAEKYSIENARAYDLGAGDGRHTIFLAQQGFQVTAIEGTQSGLERIAERAEEAGVTDRIEMIHADLRDYELPADIDLLVASYLLHLLPDPYRQLMKWGDSTRSGGMLCVSTRKRIPDDPEFYFFPDDFELKHFYRSRGWHILHAREEENWREAMQLHFRSRAVVAVKPTN